MVTVVVLRTMVMTVPLGRTYWEVVVLEEEEALPGVVVRVDTGALVMTVVEEVLEELGVGVLGLGFGGLGFRGVVLGKEVVVVLGVELFPEVVGGWVDGKVPLFRGFSDGKEVGDVGVGWVVIIVLVVEPADIGVPVIVVTFLVIIVEVESPLVLVLVL